jgi:hypothetical protein
MSDKTLKHIVASVIVLLLIYEIGTLISGLFGMVWGVLSGVAVTAVSFLTGRLAKAGVKSSLWYLLPTVLFTVFPIAFMAWKIVARDTGWGDRLASLTPFVIGFGAPVVLLSVVYYQLRKRTLEG